MSYLSTRENNTARKWPGFSLIGPGSLRLNWNGERSLAPARIRTTILQSSSSSSILCTYVLRYTGWTQSVIKKKIKKKSLTPARNVSIARRTRLSEKWSQGHGGIISRRKVRSYVFSHFPSQKSIKCTFDITTLLVLMCHISTLNLITDFHEMWYEIVPLVESPEPFICTFKSRSIYVILLKLLLLAAYIMDLRSLS